MTEEVKTNGTGEDVAAEAEVEETVAEEPTGEQTEGTGKAKPNIGDTASKTFNEAIKQFENLGKALGSALQDRANVVTVRVNDDSLRYLDMLVEADITKNRSESAAFLINEGIKANEILFNKIREITDQIAALKSQLREVVQVEDE